MKDVQGFVKESEIVSVIEAHRMISEGARPIDIRPPDVFEAGHVPGATNLPLSELLSGGSRDLGPVTLYCQAGAEVRRHVDPLRDIFGAENFYALAYGFEEWCAAGLPVVALF